MELFGPPGDRRASSRNFVLCPGKAYDRSPCGTGTSAKLACLFADGKLAEGQIWRQESILGSVFEGSVRVERENCCDDMALNFCGDRLVYARALAALEQLRSSPAALALGADGGSLLERVRRLCGTPTRFSFWGRRRAGGALGYISLPIRRACSADSFTSGASLKSTLRTDDAGAVAATFVKNAGRSLAHPHRQTATMARTNRDIRILIGWGTPQ